MRIPRISGPETYRTFHFILQNLLALKNFDLTTTKLSLVVHDLSCEWIYKAEKWNNRISHGKWVTQHKPVLSLETMQLSVKSNLSDLMSLEESVNEEITRTTLTWRMSTSFFEVDARQRLQCIGIGFYGDLMGFNGLTKL